MTFARRNFLTRAMSTASIGLFRPMVCYATDKLKKDEDQILDLPEGFHYKVIARSGFRMNDGYRFAGKPDGMACFHLNNGDWALLCNHELGLDDFDDGSYFPEMRLSPLAYNRRAAGGVSRLVIDPKSLRIKSSNLVLTGTSRNCAGGLSPWGWLTCEETSDRGHGYVFLCDPEAESVQPARKIPEYGRFKHEAATVHPKTKIAYLTEDTNRSCFYRFVPDSLSNPFKGQLQALRVKNTRKFKTYRDMAQGQQVEVDWVGIEDPSDSVADQGFRAGAAVIRRGEGLWLDNRDVYFTSTSGGPAGKGQIFKYSPISDKDGTLKVITQSNSSSVLDMPDNLTVAPNGDLFVCEDGSGRQFIRKILPTGEAISFARNALSRSEFAGACFSPDGRALFVNMQNDGLTLMITGPFESFG